MGLGNFFRSIGLFKPASAPLPEGQVSTTQTEVPQAGSNLPPKFEGANSMESLTDDQLKEKGLLPKPIELNVEPLKEEPMLPEEKLNPPAEVSQGEKLA